MLQLPERYEMDFPISSTVCILSCLFQHRIPEGTESIITMNVFRLMYRKITANAAAHAKGGEFSVILSHISSAFPDYGIAGYLLCSAIYYRDNLLILPARKKNAARESIMVTAHAAG